MEKAVSARAENPAAAPDPTETLAKTGKEEVRDKEALSRSIQASGRSIESLLKNSPESLNYRRKSEFSKSV